VTLQLEQQKLPDTGGGAALSCQHLWKVFGPNPTEYMSAAAGSEAQEDSRHVAAVRDVSFDVRPGETFVVMGLSGSGKSTLVRCLTRLIEPTSGQITLGDQSITAMNEAELREFRRGTCAMVFQHFGLLPHRTVLDNVAYGLQVAGQPRAGREQRAAEAIELVGLHGTENKHPAELSGGMQQRVGLARALVMRPRLMVLDEPFSALDPLIRKDLQDELLRLATVVRQTSIFITHDLSEALKLGDRVAVMRGGALVQVGTPEEIVMNPADDYIRRFTEDAPRSKVLRARTVAVPAHVSRTGDSAAEVLTALNAAGADHAFVCHPDGSPAGVVTSSELNQLNGAAVNMEQVMCGDPRTVHPEALLDEVLRMLAASPSPLAVVDHRGGLQGSISREDALRALVGTGTSAP